VSKYCVYELEERDHIAFILFMKDWMKTAAFVIFRPKPSKLLGNILKSILTFLHVMSIILGNSSQQPDL